MKHERISHKLLSALLAFVMLFAIAAEGAGYVYASELQEDPAPAAEQLQESDAPEESEAIEPQEQESQESQEDASEAEEAQQPEGEETPAVEPAEEDKAAAEAEDDADAVAEEPAKIPGALKVAALESEDESGTTIYFWDDSYGSAGSNGIWIYNWDGNGNERFVQMRPSHTIKRYSSGKETTVYAVTVDLATWPNLIFLNGANWSEKSWQSSDQQDVGSKVGDKDNLVYRYNNCGVNATPSTFKKFYVMDDLDWSTKLSPDGLWVYSWSNTTHVVPLTLEPEITEAYGGEHKVYSVLLDTNYTGGFLLVNKDVSGNHWDNKTQSSDQQMQQTYNSIENPCFYESAISDTRYVDPTPLKLTAAGRTLYFDKDAFEGATIQVGNGPAVALAEMEKDPNVLFYDFPEDSTADWNTVITVKKGDETITFKWTNWLNNEITEFQNDPASKPYVVTVYFDATLSKQPMEQEEWADRDGNAAALSIPEYSEEGTSTVWFCARKKDGTFAHGAMIQDEEHPNVYYGEVPGDATGIVFSNYDLKTLPDQPNRGKYTKVLELPEGLENPCFYADSQDKAAYTWHHVSSSSFSDEEWRGGYWGEAYQVRNAEKGKGTDVVDIATDDFVQEKDTIYITSSFYDYYTDYELNGNNRDAYGAWGSKELIHRNWVPFRHFDEALSDAYKDANVSIPLYTGHFQPDWWEYNESGARDEWGYRFSQIAWTLNLYGYDADDPSGFMSTNNSTMDVNGVGSHDKRSQENSKYDAAAQGLVSSSLDDDTLMTAGGEIPLPHFNEDFLRGDNSLKTVLGEVYDDVKFPFTLKEVYPEDEPGVEYWWFDSAVTTLSMQYDSGIDQYYLQDVGNQPQYKNVNSSGYAPDPNNQNEDQVSTAYGFYPFNSGSTASTSWENNYGTTYNYGFGARLDFDFHLTEDGTVKDKNGNDVPIKFQFSGDDDIWIFIDGKLVLDAGGSHGQVMGTINFAEMSATVSAVKASQGSSRGASNSPRRASAAEGVTSTFALNGKNTDKHTLTMFYMERGMWESNMQVCFNFPDENDLTVTKKVDTEDVNDLFTDVFADASFSFSVKNLATHFTAQEGKPVGFRTQQNAIPDYGTATSGQLAAAAGAEYTSSLDDNNSKEVKEVSGQGEFEVKNGESVTFEDQFRRGSYIALKEVKDEQEGSLYETSWEILEKGEPVSNLADGDSVINPADAVKGADPLAVTDGRTETIRLERNEGIGNAYQTAGNAVRPDEDVFVFRSYENPDLSSVATQLEVVYTNKVNTASLTIEKEKAYETDVLDETYQFVVAFHNIGGMDLEDETIYSDIIGLSVGDSYTIDGIPVGTEYTIYELKTMTDGSGLNRVEVDGETAAFTTGSVNGIDAYAVSGTMANEKGTEITYTFKNTVIPEEPEIPDEPTPDEPTPDVPAPAEPAPAEATTVTEHHRKNSGTAKTGDDSNLMLWTVLGLTSLAACGGALVLTRKKAKTQTGKRQR